jgi:hypothetical protein
MREYRRKTMKRLASIVLLATLLGAAFLMPIATQAAPQTQAGELLKNMPVAGTLSDGGTFNGVVSITQFGYDTTKGLTVNGILEGTATTSDGSAHEAISQPFSNVPATLNESASGAANGFSRQLQVTCGILDLDIGAIHLDLLGLVVDLAPVHLDLTAVPGAGNLLGNLLCGVAGLLDPLGFLNQLVGTLSALLALLNQINQLLG